MFLDSNSNVAQFLELERREFSFGGSIEDVGPEWLNGTVENLSHSGPGGTEEKKVEFLLSFKPSISDR